MARVIVGVDMFASFVCLLVAVLAASSSEAKLDQDGVSISHVTALLPFNPPSLPGSSLRKPVRFKLEVGSFVLHPFLHWSVSGG